MFEVRYFGGRLDNEYYYADNPRPHGVPDYIIPDGPFHLVIDASVTKIAGHACFGCARLIEVVFHNRVTEIGSYAFGNCSNLQPIELPEGLLRVEQFAFRGCKSLQQIVVPATVHHFGRGIFEDCFFLESVVFAPTTNVVELGSLLFWRCSSLQFVTLPPNLRSIPQRFFYNCTSLTHLHIPESVQQIEEYAFSGSGLRSIHIPSIHIPEQVHQIDRDAFKNCAFLERITIHSTNLNLGTDIFVNCPLLSTIMIAPLLWPKLFVSMKGQPDFIIKFFRHYHTKIFAFNEWWINRNVHQESNEE